jgi:hypothetical protein
MDLIMCGSRDRIANFYDKLHDWKKITVIPKNIEYDGFYLIPCDNCCVLWKSAALAAVSVRHHLLEKSGELALNISRLKFTVAIKAIAVDSKHFAAGYFLLILITL